MENAALLDGIDDFLGSAGSKKVPVVTATIEDVLGPEHVAEYLEKVGDLDTTQKSHEKDIVAVRAKHHSVARLLATGMAESVVAEMTGFTPSHISTLKNNPSMIELVAHYRAPGNKAVEQIAEKMRTVGQMALERLTSRLENDELDNNELIQTAKLGADRSGNGPTASVRHQHEHSLDVEQIAKMAEEARRRNAERIVPIEAVRQALPAPTPSTDLDG